MAKVTITLVDLPNGRVGFECEPSFEVMSKKCIQNDASPAEGWAVFVKNQLKYESQKTDEPTRIVIPRIHGG